VFKHLIEPVAKKCGYAPLWAHDIAGSRAITKEVIEYLVSAPLVIADLTGANPNVFYELALRHAVQKPFIQIVDKSEELKFDLREFRTLKFELSDIRSETDAKRQLKRYIDKAEADLCETPISIARLNPWVPSPEKEKRRPNPELGSNAKRGMNDVLLELLGILLAAEATTDEVRSLVRGVISQLRASTHVQPLQDNVSDLNAAGYLVKQVPSGGTLSATSSLQHDDVEGREIYRDTLNDALKRNVTYRKIICYNSTLSDSRYYTWMVEFNEKVRLISAGSIDPDLFQLLHYPLPMSVDVLISQDADGECREMVAGFAGGEEHRGFKTDDPKMVREWLDVYLGRKIIPMATEHTQAVVEGRKACDCSEFLNLLKQAKQEATRNKNADS